MGVAPADLIRHLRSVELVEDLVVATRYGGRVGVSDVGAVSLRRAVSCVGRRGEWRGVVVAIQASSPATRGRRGRSGAAGVGSFADSLTRGTRPRGSRWWWAADDQPSI
mgnify:CR=1 FL=1